jgi:hypothetical protein
MRRLLTLMIEIVLSFGPSRAKINNADVTSSSQSDRRDAERDECGKAFRPLP